MGPRSGGAAPARAARAADGDAFDVVEMSLLGPSNQSPFLQSLRGGRGRARTIAHLGNDLAHRVVHDRRFVEVHLTDHEPKPKRSAKAGERPRFFHAESHAVLDTGGGVADGEEDAFAAEFKMDAEFQGDDEQTCTGGSLFAKGSPELDLAETVLDNCIDLLRRLGGEKRDEPDALWKPNPNEHHHRASVLGGMLHLDGHSHHEQRRAPLVESLLGAAGSADAAGRCAVLFAALGATLRDNPSPQINICRAPCKIFGDLHGQFRDLLLFFLEFGCPSHRCGDVEYCEYVFNGDWVDRGAHQLECLVLLAALKVRYPRRIHLNRGNHESAAMCQSMTERGDRGFDRDCGEKLGIDKGAEVFQKACVDVFRWLPLATIVESAVLVVHGGIGDGKWTLGDLADVPYPLDEVRDHPLAWQLCWSDPDWRGDGVEARGVHASVRGLDTKTFGPDVSRAFCHMNGINCIVRSHEYVPQGVMIQHGGYVVTVFSARDYDYHDKNDKGEQNCGAIISVTHDTAEGRDIIRLRAKIIEKCVA